MSGLNYLDGSHHAHWKEHVDAAPAFEAELLAAGFVAFGLLVAVPSDGDTIGSEHFEGDDQALSCIPGTQWDAAAGACIPVASS